MFRLTWLLAVNIAVFLALLEATGLAYYALRDGHLYYLGREAIVRERASEIASGLRDADSEHLRRALSEGLTQSKVRLDLYYGYNALPHDSVAENDAHGQAVAARSCKHHVNVACEGGKVFYVTNNYGFDSVYDYPYQKQRGDEFVIRLFGESVALNLVKTTMPELFDDILAQVPQLRGRTVTLLSFAREGFKQPQQLAALAYFLSLGQRFDLVINIDGVNAVLQALVNERKGVDYSMPSVGQTGYLLDLFSAALCQGTTRRGLQDFYFWKGVREVLLQRMAAMPLAGPALLLDLGFEMAGRMAARAERAAAKPDLSALAGRPVLILPQKAGTSSNEAVAESVAVWRRSSLLMARMLQRLGIPYLHVLQPNQYFSKKPFGEAERRVALDWSIWYAQPTHDGYRLLAEEGRTLVKEEVDLASAVDLDDNVAEPLYTDDCCHTNREGTLLLAKFVAAHLPATP